jgi:hypothetical protein
MFNRYDLVCVTERLHSWRVDLICIVGLLCLNPVLYGMRLPLNLTPDAVGYLSLAESLAGMGKLYLESWGHIDTAAILPPLYPLLIAGLNVIRPDPVTNALLLSAMAVLTATVLIYFYIRRFTPALIATAAVLLIQLNFYYVYLASSVLTEALFLSLLIAALFLATRLTQDSRPNAWHGVTLGIIVGLVFLTRQVGLVAGVFLALWFVVDAMRRPDAPPRRLRLPLLFLAGWVGIVGPYAIVLYCQTGQTVLRQSYRMNVYVVSPADQAVLDKINRLEHTGDVSYLELYKSRRQLWELTPDSSEMLAYIVTTTDDNAGLRSGNGGLGESVSQFLRNAVSNVIHFTDRFGKLLLALVVLASVTPLFLRPPLMPWWPRLLLPGFLITYGLALSVLTGAVARYFIVLIPLALAQIAIELGVFFHWWRARRQRSRFAHVAIALVFALLLLLAPQTVLNAPPFLHPYRSMIKSSLVPGEPVFSLLPVYAYLSGGSFRIMPNDKLEKVVHYAHRTGVRWLLVPRQPERILDTQFYVNAIWLRDPQALMKKTNLLRFCCVLSTGHEIEDHLVFEILPKSSLISG